MCKVLAQLDDGMEREKSVDALFVGRVDSSGRLYCYSI